MRIDAGLDTGPMLLRGEIEIFPDETSVSVSPRLAQLAAELMVETLRALQTGRIKAQPQDNSQATLAPLLKKEDGLIDFSRSAREIYNRFRGFQPWPGAFTTFRGKGLSVTAMRPAAAQVAPGEVLVTGKQVFAGCGDGTAVELLEVQPEGKKKISVRDFVHGYRPKTGELLD
jgi:methionyl-tRNA formyltransferase